MAKIKLRRDTAANWTAANPTLAQGEPAFEHDTGKLKIGDGVSDWATLAYFASSGGPAGATDSIVNTDGTNQYSVVVDEAGIVTMNTARGAIEFGAQPEVGAPQHFHIMRAPDNTYMDVFFGDDNNYFMLPSGSNGALIGAYNSVDSIGHAWHFDPNGMLSLPGPIKFADATEMSTAPATVAYVDSAVANLVNSAPAALDTLNELSAALGNDANFATTIANQLSTIEGNITALQGSSPSTLVGLSDVSDSLTTGLQTGQQLQWNGTQWTRGWTQILQTSDTVSNANLGIVLKSAGAAVSNAQMDGGDNFLYNPSTKTVTLEGQTITAAKIQSWDSAAASSGGTTLANGTVDGQALIWDTATSTWVAGTQITANNFVTTVSELTTTALDFAKGVQTITVSAPKSFTATGTTAGKSYSLTLIITSTNGAPLTWPTGTQWPGGAAPSFDPGTHIVTLVTVDNGTTFYGVALNNYA